MKKNYLILLFTIFSLLSSKNVSAQGSDPFIGEIILFAGNYAPPGWAICDGRILQVSQYNILYAIIGNLYGGSPGTTFALPDLRGRVPVGFGSGQGLTNVSLGQMAGTESVTLTTANLPAHNHILYGSTATGNSNVPTGNFHADTSVLDKDYNTSNANLVPMNPQSIGATGSNIPFPIKQPYIGINYIIALEGIYPSRP